MKWKYRRRFLCLSWARLNHIESRSWLSRQNLTNCCLMDESLVGVSTTQRTIPEYLLFFKYIPDHLSRMRDATTKLGPGAPSRSHASSQVAQKIQLQYSEKTKNQLITLCSQPTAPAEHHHRHHHKPYSLICWKGAIWKICRKFKRKDLGTGRK